MVPVTTLQGVMQGFQGRCGTAQHNRCALQLPPFDSEVTRRVAEAVLLFEGAVVLFVDNDQARPQQAAENGRPGAHYNRCGTRARRLPGGVALSVVEA